MTDTEGNRNECLSKDMDKRRKVNKIGLDRGDSVTAPDGGWGWVIVFAVFTGNCLMDGCVGSYGIFYPELLRAFDAGPVITSMAGSLLPAVHMLTSPLVGSLDRKFGSRPVCFVGGCVGAIGLILASLADSMTMFMVTFGVVLGIGISMNYLPGHVITNNYFNKKRGIAGGIVCSGAGFGMFILAPVLQILVTEYGWRGAMLITAGIVMQLCACSTLLRPLCKDKKQLKHFNKYNECDTAEANKQLEDVLVSSDSVQYKDNVDCSKTEDKINDTERHKHCTPKELVRLTQADRSASDDTLAVNQKLIKLTHEQELELVTRSLQDMSMFHKVSKMESFLRNSQFLDPVAVLAQSQQINSEAEVTFSVHSLYEIDVDKRKRPRCCRSLPCDMSILRNRTFIPLLLGGVLIQMGQFIPNMFLPEYCFSIGLSGTQMSVIMALYGAVNILGRLSAGCLANTRHIDALWLCNMGMFMCGVGCVMFSLCTTFESLCIYAVAMGYFIGYFPPLQIIVIIECLGIDKLTSSLGLLQMAKGPAALLGPPLAGLVYQYTQNYAMSLGFAGLLFLLSAGIQSLVPVSNMCSRNTKNSKINTDVEIIVK